MAGKSDLHAKLHSSLGIPPLPSHSPDTIAALLWAREVIQKHLETTYSVKDPKGIEELKPVKIGGVDQWLHIRGRNCENPVLLYLHGGPGYPLIGFMDAIQRPWEDYFTVVHWDQRQVGKSYYPADDNNAPLTIQQMLDDADEVIQYLRDHLEQDKLFVLGHSWGSVLGIHMVKNRPEWLHAYIGVGQVVNMMDNERVAYERLLGHAIEQNEEALVARLLTIAPYPDPEHPGKSLGEEEGGFVREELSRLAGEALAHHTPFQDFIQMMAFEQLISPHLTLTDIAHYAIGDKPAIARAPYQLTEEYMTTDLPRDVGSRFEVPIFFFSGKHDWQVPVSLSDQWFERIEAPYKELLHFEESSHFIINEEPGKFLTALVNKVLPFVEAEREMNNA